MFCKPATTLCSALLLSVTAASPAPAATGTFPDQRGDGAGASDIHRVDVAYGRSALQVRVRVRNVAKVGGMAVYVDSRPQKAGPELVLLGPVGIVDSDWRVTRISRGWRPGTEELLCDTDLRSRRAGDVAQVEFDASCLRNPDTVDLRTGEVTERRRWKAPAETRVGVRTARGDSVDWSPAANRLHPGVSRG